MCYAREEAAAFLPWVVTREFYIPVQQPLLMLGLLVWLLDQSELGGKPALPFRVSFLHSLYRWRWLASSAAQASLLFACTLFMVWICAWNGYEWLLLCILGGLLASVS